MKIIDSHVHIGKTDKITEYYTFDSFLTYMDKYNIDRAISFPNISTKISSNELNKKFLNSFKKQKHKDRFFPFLLIDPRDLITLNQIQDNEIYGVKYHPSYTRIKCNQSSMFCFFEYCDNINIPITIHCGRDKISDISYIIDVARKYRNVNFIAAHLGGNVTDKIEIAINLVSKYQYDNIYFDTSCGKSARLIKKAIDIVGDDKIIFGSDEPYADFIINKACIDLSEISSHSTEKVFYKNILSILGENVD